MLTTLLVLQILIAVAMVIIILLQKSSADGMAGFGGGQSGDSLLSGRASANILTRATTILAAAFLLNSLLMAAMVSRSESFAERFSKKEQQKLEETVAPQEGTSEQAPTVPLAD